MHKFILQYMTAFVLVRATGECLMLQISPTHSVQDLGDLASVEGNPEAQRDFRDWIHLTLVVNEMREVKT